MKDDEKQLKDLLPPDLIWHINAEFARHVLIDVAVEAFEAGYRGRETLLCYEENQLEDLAELHSQAMDQVRDLVEEYETLGAHYREEETYTWDGASLPCTCAIQDAFAALGIDDIAAWYDAKERIDQIANQTVN